MKTSIAAYDLTTLEPSRCKMCLIHSHSGIRVVEWMHIFERSSLSTTKFLRDTHRISSDVVTHLKCVHITHILDETTILISAVSHG